MSGCWAGAVEIETSQPEAHRNRTLLQLAGGGAWPSSSADRCADRCNARPDPPDLRPPPTFWIRPPLKPSLPAFSKIQREQQDGNQINTRTKQKKKERKKDSRTITLTLLRRRRRRMASRGRRWRRRAARPRRARTAWGARALLLLLQQQEAKKARMQKIQLSSSLQPRRTERDRLNAHWETRIRATNSRWVDGRHHCRGVELKGWNGNDKGVWVREGFYVYGGREGVRGGWRWRSGGGRRALKWGDDCGWSGDDGGRSTGVAIAVANMMFLPYVTVHLLSSLGRCLDQDLTLTLLSIFRH